MPYCVTWYFQGTSQCCGEVFDPNRLLDFGYMIFQCRAENLLNNFIDVVYSTVLDAPGLLQSKLSLLGPYIW